MDKSKTLADFLKGLTAVTSVSDLSMICADSSGKLKKVNPRENAQSIWSTIEDANNLTSISRICFALTGADTLNLPEESSTKWGAIMQVSFSETNGFQVWFQFNGTPIFFKRQKYQGKWRVWNASNSI